MSTKKLLEVGDVVYRFVNNEVCDRFVVDRTTNTLAICNDIIRFKKEVSDNGTVICTSEKFFKSLHKIETPEIKEMWVPVELTDRIINSDLSTLTTDQLRRMADIIQEKKEREL